MEFVCRILPTRAALRWQAKAGESSDSLNVEEILSKLTELLSNDLDTPGALTYLSQVTNEVGSRHIPLDMKAEFTVLIQSIDDLLGLWLMEVPDITDQQKAQIAEREQARGNQNWEESDRIRDELLKQSIALNDTPEGTIWIPASPFQSPDHQ